MNIKKATPQKNAAPIPKANSIIKLTAPYERRCLAALLKSPVERTDLDKAIGTTNSPEFIRQLKRKGLVIHTENIPFMNRDGKNSWRGKYHLDPLSRKLAKAMLGGCK